MFGEDSPSLVNPICAYACVVGSYPVDPHIQYLSNFCANMWQIKQLGVKYCSILPQTSKNVSTQIYFDKLFDKYLIVDQSLFLKKSSTLET